MIRRGYDLDAEEIKLAVRWLELNSPEDNQHSQFALDDRFVNP